MNNKFDRQVHRISRVLEYFSEKEIQMQIGVSKREWPVAIVKELIDNALDACESAEILPHIDVSMGKDTICVEDNGPGLPKEVIKESLDFMYRVSDKSHYVSPSRGQLGNALKCIYAIPFIVDAKKNSIEITTGGQIHRVAFILNLLAQTPECDYTVHDTIVRNGTSVEVRLNFQACLNEDKTPDFYKTRIGELISRYAGFNPHANFSFHDQHYERSVSEYQKWRPCDKIPPHWYSIERLRNLIAAHIYAENHGGRVRTVREFISEIRGFTSPAKQQRVTKALNLSKSTYLHDLIDNGNVDLQRVGMLLQAMKSNSKEVNPRLLGIIGEEHLKRWMIKRRDVVPDSIRYSAKYGKCEKGLPYALEVAFGLFKDNERTRTIESGLNWAPTFKDPFRLIGEQTAEAMIDYYDPVLLLIHLVYPQLRFISKGKGEVDL